MQALADPGSLTQARYELDRARDFGGDAEKARWAERWGPGLVAMDLDFEDEDEVDTSAVGRELESATDGLEKLVAALEAPAGEIDLSALLTQGRACVDDLLKASEELEKL